MPTTLKVSDRRRHNYAECQVPFPEIPGEAKPLEQLWLRPFGLLAEDCEVNFTQTVRPYLETQILQCCTYNREGETPNPEFFWNLDVSKRTECLALVAALGEVSEEVTLDLRCRNPDCREEMELELTGEELAGLQNKTGGSSTIEVCLGDRTFSLRKPRGLDQVAWLSQSFADETAAVRAMVQSLLPEEQRGVFEQIWENRDDWMQSLDRMMEEMDPLVNFRLQLVCPCCDTEDLYEVDLGELCLGRLRQAQDRLLESVYCLASHFHWNEEEIFALPPWRRERYLKLIEREQK